jgi:dienelactone hydrolase
MAIIRMTGRRVLFFAVLALGAGSSFSAVSARQAGTAAAASTEAIRIVNVAQRGGPPSGPSAVVIEHDQTLATHTIYRPADLGNTKHGVLVWGEGGCAKNGLTFPEFLTELASHGFVILADGPPVENAGRRGGPDGAAAPGGGAPRAGGPPPGGAPAAGRPGGAPGGGAGGPGRGAAMTDGTALVAAIDWIEKQNNDRSSRFYQKVETGRVAAMGMSCGGLMSYGASADRRVATVGIWNSGLIQPDEKIFAGLHSPVIIVTGGESDIAYANGKRDFETMPAKIPVFYGVHPSVGHGGTYNEDNGGAFGVMAVAWLKWQLMGDTSAGGRGYFAGAACGACGDSKWQIQSRGLP